MKRVIIGAHLSREDVEPLEDAIPASGVFLSGVPVADDQPLGDRDLLVRVAGIRAQLLERATFVAIRYGLAVASEADAGARVAAHAARWRALLVAHRGHVEMTLKVAAENVSRRPDRREFTSGAEYLKALHGVVRSAHVAPDFQAAVARLLEPLAVRSQWQNRDEKSVEWNALVARDAVPQVREAGDELRRACSSTPFLLSGPWPLEVFADADRE